MTISSGIESQINPNIANQAKKTADAPSGPKAGAEAKVSAETPAVVVDTASQQSRAADEKLATVEVGSAAEASSLAQRVSAALSQQTSSIANQSTAAVAGLLTELEAAFA